MSNIQAGDVFLRYDINSIARVSAIIGGLTVTMLGYIVGRVSTQSRGKDTLIGMSPGIKRLLPIN